MNRYDSGKKRKDKDTGREFYSSIMYPKIERTPEDIYIRGKGTLAIPAGKQIRIPMDTDKIIGDFNEMVQQRRVI